jgi:hypothetical protein
MEAPLERYEDWKSLWQGNVETALAKMEESISEFESTNGSDLRPVCDAVQAVYSEKLRQAGFYLENEEKFYVFDGVADAEGFDADDAIDDLRDWTVCELLPRVQSIEPNHSPSDRWLDECILADKAGRQLISATPTFSERFPDLHAFKVLEPAMA